MPSYGMAQSEAGAAICCLTNQSGINISFKYWIIFKIDINILIRCPQICTLKLYTASAAPSAPQWLRSAIAGTTWVQLIWYAPATLNGLISYYTVVLNSTSSNATLSSNDTYLNATGLVLCTLYTIAVSATTGCGAGCTGPLSAAIDVYTRANSMRTLLFTVDRITLTNSKALQYYVILCCIAARVSGVRGARCARLSLRALGDRYHAHLRARGDSWILFRSAPSSEFLLAFLFQPVFLGFFFCFIVCCSGAKNFYMYSRILTVNVLNNSGRKKCELLCDLSGTWGTSNFEDMAHRSRCLGHWAALSLFRQFGSWPYFSSRLGGACFC